MTPLNTINDIPFGEWWHIITNPYLSAKMDSLSNIIKKVF
jgi:hypothetical protein